MEFKFTLSNFTKNVFSFIFIHKCSLKQKYIVFKWCHCWNIWYLLVMCMFFRVSYSVDHLLGNCENTERIYCRFNTAVWTVQVAKLTDSSNWWLAETGNLILETFQKWMSSQRKDRNIGDSLWMEAQNIFPWIPSRTLYLVFLYLFI